MEHAPKINKVEVRTLQMADYRQLSQSFTRVYSDNHTYAVPNAGPGNRDG